MKMRIGGKKINPLWVIAFLEIVYLAVYILAEGKNIIDSDMSAEMVLGSILNRDHELMLAKNWFYSTELRVLNSQLFYRLFLLMFPTHWRIARMFATVAMHIVLAGGIYYLARKAKLKDFGAAAAMLAFCPFGGEYNWIVTIGCFYTIPVAMAFYTMALMISIAEKEDSRKSKVAMGTILFVLAILGGTAGIRYLMVCSGPIFLTVVSEALHQYIRGDRLKMTSKISKKMIASFGILLTSGVGYIVNVKILSHIYVYENISGAQLSDFDLTRFITSLGKLCELLGWRSGSAFSILGLQSALALLLFLLVCFSNIYFIRHQRSYSENEYIISMYSGISLLLGIVAISVTDWNDVRYAIPGIMLSFLSMDIAFHKWIDSLRNNENDNIMRIKRIRISAGMFLIIVVMGYCVKPNMVFYKAERTQNLRDAVYFLMENNLTKGYATVFNSNTPTELSNGLIEIWTMEDIQEGETIKIREFLQDKRHIQNPEGKVFVLLDSDENALAPSYARASNLVYDHRGYFIYVYDSVDELLKAN